MTSEPAIHHQTRAAWVGAITAPLCWFTQQMTIASLTGTDCGLNWLEAWITIGFAALMLIASAVSALTWIRGSRGGQPDDFTRRRAHFVSAAGTTFPLLFLLIMIWQTAAHFVYAGCER